MHTYAVEYTYSDDSARLDAVREVHREFLRALVPDVLVVAGAYQEAEKPGALLVMRGESAAEVTEILDGDPFHLAGLIIARNVRLWNPGIGYI